MLRTAMPTSLMMMLMVPPMPDLKAEYINNHVKTGHKDHRRSQPKRRKLARQAHGHQRFKARLRGC